MLMQDDYALYTGESVSYADTDWQKIVSVASGRLASFLCLETLPELTEENQDLADLLANFICATLKFRGNHEDAQSKSVRNFTISFRKGAADAFAQISNDFEDIIEKYSECGCGFTVERNARRCCCGN